MEVCKRLSQVSTALHSLEDRPLLGMTWMVAAFVVRRCGMNGTSKSLTQNGFAFNGMTNLYWLWYCR